MSREKEETSLRKEKIKRTPIIQRQEEPKAIATVRLIQRLKPFTELKRQGGCDERSGGGGEGGEEKRREGGESRKGGEWR